ncbi:MAG: hypothetical protein KAS32_23605 [Candidatus Peribacteraceae bacterium]|nr:hypothetical protein [Candidatus Peribacteraceae bacterium]
MKKREQNSRASFMSIAHREAMGELPRTHANCFEKTGVMRPGKTAKDRAKLGL